MDKKLVGLLRQRIHVGIALYAAQRIEELEKQLQEVEKALAIAMDALEHCETADPELTGNVLDVIEEQLTPEALARICECAREVCAR